MQRMTFLVFGLAAAALLSSTASGFAGPDVPCTCRFKGQDMQIGDLVCANLPNGDVMMVCDHVLNNTAWKTVQQGCPVTQDTSPAMTPISG